jgi:molecular chaperone GrpE
MEDDKLRTINSAKAATIMKLLPIVDDIERAVGHIPADLADNQWAKGVSSLSKSLDKSLIDLGVTRIAAAGRPFDPNLHEAVSADGDGTHEVVSDELRAGYALNGQVIRHSLVKVLRQDMPAEIPEVAQDVIQDAKADEEVDEVKGED